MGYKWEVGYKAKGGSKRVLYVRLSMVLGMSAAEIRLRNGSNALEATKKEVQL